MLDDSKTHLLIFYNGNGIEIDTSLPKYRNLRASMDDIDNANSERKTVITGQELLGMEVSEMNIALSNNMKKVVAKMNDNSRMWVIPSEGQFLPGKEPWYHKAFVGIKNYTEKLMSSIAPNEIDVAEFFNDVKITTEESKGKYVSRVKDYLIAIYNANRSGQVAYKEILFNNIIINKYESLLYASDLYKCITEEQLVEFANKTNRGLKLTYIKNYVRPIPTDVISYKEKVDELEVFDNYVVLHYDPDEKFAKKTEKEKQEEIERAKDPILFGLIANSNKLYFVKDWIDESVGDDLTFDKIVEALGEEKLSDSYLTEKIEF